MEQYPFYERGVNSYEDVHEYLRTWLKPEIGQGEISVMVDGEKHACIQLAGFRRAFVQHLALIKCDAPSKYAFAIRDDDKEELMCLTSWSDSYEQMIKDATSEYCRLWKIVDDDSQVPDTLGNIDIKMM